MVKTLTFGEKEIRFSTAFAWTFAYRSQFGQDPMKLLIPAIRKIEALEGDDTQDEQAYILFEELGATGITQVAWAMAKLCDPAIADPLDWVASIGEDYDLSVLLAEVVTEALTSCFTTKKSQAPIPEK